MTLYNHTLRVAIILGSVLGGGALWADSAEREVATQINSANALLRRGEVDGALRAYEQVDGDKSERADLSYNFAVAQYRKGNLAAAENLFRQATSAESDEIAARARYNLGNCYYATALKQAEDDYSAAIKNFTTAIDHYRSCT